MKDRVDPSDAAVDSKKSDVFISFIHEESATAEALQNFVNQMFSGQARAFLSSDRFEILAGEPWLDRILQELKAAKVVLLLLSQKSVGRPWVNFEAGIAWLTKKVIPICIKDMTKDILPKPYSYLTAIDLKYTEDMLYLIRSIAGHLGVEAPDIATKFGEALSPLGGPDTLARIEAQRGYVDQFQRELKSAIRVEKVLESYEEGVKSGKYVGIRSLLKAQDQAEEKK